jgi:hypothetical protein
MPFKGASRLRQIAVQHVEPANFTDKPADKVDPQAGHPPMPGMPVTHYKGTEPQVKPSAAPHPQAVPFKLH